MMTAEQLKASILQLAMEGKLVEQRPEEGTGEELYQQIQAKKVKLIREGKIKKQEPLSEITDDEKPFDIPKNWRWVRFGTIMNVVSARRVHQADWRKTGIPFYRAREIARLADYGTVENELYIDNSLYEEYAKTGVPRPGDLMVTGVGTLGKTYIVREGDKFYYKDASVLCFENYARVSASYIKACMESPLMRMQIKSNSSGTTVATLTMVRMNEYIIPLPPLPEQYRITQKIEELMPFVGQYATASAKLDRLNTEFPDQVKKSILQMAVEGKLVEQRPEEGTGEELFRKIQEEKAKLIKEGKIKKQKPLTDIADEEKPFDIPESWRWVRVGDIGDWASGATPSRSHSEYYGGNIPWLKTGDLNDGYIYNVPESITNDGFNHSSVRLNPKGSVLMAMYGATIGKLGILDIPATTNQACCACICSPFIFNKYLFYYLLSRRKAFIEMGAGGAQPNISKEKIVMYCMPLPPLEEQKRIAAKLDNLIPVVAELNM